MDTETSTTTTTNHASLNKAASLLGVNEINNLDYKSLNSIRKLSDKFGCMEYDLIKNLTIDATQNLIKLDDDEFKNDIDKVASLPDDNKQQVENLTEQTSTDYSRRNKIVSFLKKKPLGNNNDKAPVKLKKEEKSDVLLLSHNKLENDLSETDRKDESKQDIPKVDTEDTLEDSKDAKLRHIELDKDDFFGFGFIAGSEKPLVIRFISPSGPAHEKLLNGDEIISINNENVQFASREHVIDLIKNTGNKIQMTVKQPTPISESSVLLTEEKKATKKTKKNLNKVRFQLENNETSSLNGTNDDDFESDETKDMDNEFDDAKQETIHDTPVDYMVSSSNTLASSKSIFKVYLENNMIKSFKYDGNTTVKDVLGCLKNKLKLKYIDYFGICLKLNNNLNSLSSRNLVLFDETRLLLEIVNEYENFEYYLRFLFVPVNLEILLYKDMHSFHYLYEQTCNDIRDDVYGNEIDYDSILNIVSLMLLHDYVPPQLPITSSHGSLNTSKSIKAVIKFIDNDINMETFVPKSIVQSPFIKPKVFRRHIRHQVELLYKTQYLSKDEIKLEFLKFIATNVHHFLSGHVFLATLLDKKEEAMITISSNFGISVYADFKSKTLKPLAKFESIENVNVSWHSENLVRIRLDITEETSDQNEKVLDLALLKDDYLAFLYLLQGYLRIFVYPVSNSLCPIHEIQGFNLCDLNIPAFLVKHPQVVNNCTIESFTNQHAKYFDKQNTPKFKNSINITPINKILNLNYQQDDEIKMATIDKEVGPAQATMTVNDSSSSTLKRNLHHELIQRIKDRVQTVEDRRKPQKKSTNGNESSYKKRFIANFLNLKDNTELLSSEKRDFSLAQPSDLDWYQYSDKTKLSKSDESSLNSNREFLLHDDGLENLYFYNIKV